MKSESQESNRVLVNLVCAGLSGCTAELLALPVDTVKTTLMADKHTKVSIQAIFHTIRELSKDGMRAFFKGLAPGLHRQLVFATIRIGLYEPVRAGSN